MLLNNSYIFRYQGSKTLSERMLTLDAKRRATIPRAKVKCPAWITNAFPYTRQNNKIAKSNVFIVYVRTQKCQLFQLLTILLQRACVLVSCLLITTYKLYYNIIPIYLSKQGKESILVIFWAYLYVVLLLGVGKNSYHKIKKCWNLIIKNIYNAWKNLNK